MNLLAPCGFGLLRFLAAFFPIHWLLTLGRWSAPVMYGLFPTVRRNLLDNARHILGKQSHPRQQRELAVGVLKSFSRFAIEVMTAHRHLPADEQLFEEMQGSHHYEQAKKVGKGIIGVTIHMGNYELGPMLLTRFHEPVAIVYNQDRVGLFEKVRSRRRRLHGVLEIPIDPSPLFGVNILRVLREQGLVLLAGDIGFESTTKGDLYPFLGAKARFLGWPARLSMASQAPLLPCFIMRDSQDRYRLEICAPIFPGERDGVEDIMTALVEIFAEYVQRYPDQWLILHRYWEPE